MDRSHHIWGDDASVWRAKMLARRGQVRLREEENDDLDAGQCPRPSAAASGTAWDTIRRQAFPPPSGDGLRGAPYVLRGHCGLDVCTRGHHNELADGGGERAAHKTRHVAAVAWDGTAAGVEMPGSQ